MSMMSHLRLPLPLIAFPPPVGGQPGRIPRKSSDKNENTVPIMKKSKRRASEPGKNPHPRVEKARKIQSKDAAACKNGKRVRKPAKNSDDLLIDVTNDVSEQNRASVLTPEPLCALPNDVVDVNSVISNDGSATEDIKKVHRGLSDKITALETG
jgi:hypothetical protein